VSDQVMLGQRAAATDPGRRRRRNEDSYVLEPPLFAIADGMGGAQAGEIASRLAAAAVQAATATAGSAVAGAERVVALIQEANRRVYERSSSDETVQGMGTTLTVALLDDSIVHFGHVGDSRAYLVRDGRLDQVTEDHSLVAELVRSGKLSPEEADQHPQRSVITRALGTDPDVDVDAFSIEAHPGDIFMICSDGLTTMVDEDRILTAIERGRSDLRRAAKALVDAANKSGGEDNITVVLFEIAGAEEQTMTTPAPVAIDEPPLSADEDTLDELDRVPAIETMVIPPAQIESQLRSPRDGVPPVAAREPAAAPRRRPARERRVSRAILLFSSLTIVIVLAALVVWGLSRSYFVGATKDGRVAVYQGFPWDLVGSLRLYRLRYESPLLAGQLSQEERKALFSHDLIGYDTALRRVKLYEDEVVR
jgi:protein phosphatase